MPKKINKKDQIKNKEHEHKEHNEKEHKEPCNSAQIIEPCNSSPVIAELVATIPDTNVIVHKKRGRKPKGGKIICANETITSKNIVTEPNIILHLKCRKEDLDELVDENNITCVKYEPNIQNVENYHFDNSKSGELHFSSLDNNISSDEQKMSSCENKNSHPTISHDEYTKQDNSINSIKHDKNPIKVTITTNSNNNNIKETNEDFQEETYNSNDASTTKLIRRKIKELSIQLHNNDIADKKSACFWCTFDFDNPPIYIPKYELNNTYYCYGCFCSPECATASLFKESIDISVKFERYHLLNHIYCKIYDYNKNIKPAPDPYYMLDKYYGNLTIQEYRRLLKNNRLILIVDKPFTRSLPELYDENDDYIINNKTIPSSNNNNSSSKYKLRQGKNKNSKAKNIILNENFNF
jgi:hypothetical protein